MPYIVHIDGEEFSLEEFLHGLAGASLKGALEKMGMSSEPEVLLELCDSLRYLFETVQQISFKMAQRSIYGHKN